MSRLSMQPAGLAGWDEVICSLPGAHALQSREWALVKGAYGWTPMPYIWKDAGGQVKAAALLLERSATPLKLGVLYAPRGPLLDWGDASLRAEVLDGLQALARRRRAILVKIDPEVELGRGVPGTPGSSENPTGAAVTGELERRGWRFSEGQVQFRNTVVVDLCAPYEERLARLKQKWRYNLRLAEKKGVQVRPVGEDELPLLYQMYAETSVRDGFVIRPQAYYLHVWRTFMAAGMATPLLAEVEGQAVAGLVLFHFGGRAWYLYGMSRDLQRERMPNYLLQWEAMQRAVALGCRSYDLWGAPDVFDESDSMWGVFRFKEGMGGEVIRTLGAWDYAPGSLMYNAYMQFLPRLLAVLRRRGVEKTRREVSL